MYNCIINRVHPSGTLGYTSIDLQPSAGASCLTSGLAVDSNNHLWVTSRVTPGFVFRVDANSDSAPVIGVVRNTGSNTAGVSIDSFGRPWATSIDRWGRSGARSKAMTCEFEVVCVSMLRHCCVFV